MRDSRLSHALQGEVFLRVNFHALAAEADWAPPGREALGGRQPKASPTIFLSASIRSALQGRPGTLTRHRTATPPPDPAASGHRARPGATAALPHLFMICISSAQRSRLRGLSSCRHCLMATCSPVSCGHSTGWAKRGSRAGAPRARPPPTLLCQRMTLPKPPVPRRSRISQGPQVTACSAGGRLMAGPAPLLRTGASGSGASARP